MIVAEAKFLPASPPGIQWNSLVRLSEDLGAMTKSSPNVKWQGFLSCVIALCVQVSFEFLFLSKPHAFYYFGVVAFVHLGL